MAKMAPADYREFVRVSVDLPMNPKLAMIDDPAAGWAYVTSLCYCGQNRNLSFPVNLVLRTAGVGRRVGRKLLDGGLWHDGRHGCRDCGSPERGMAVVHDYELFQPCPMQHWRPAIPETLRRSVYERDGYACLHCGSPEALSLDHVFPFSWGGEDTFENFQTLCLPCNKRKGVRV